MAMTVAGFSGGSRRTWPRDGLQAIGKRMREVEAKMRAGMTRNGIVGAQQDAIVHSTTYSRSTAFPSHTPQASPCLPMRARI